MPSRVRLDATAVRCATSRGLHPAEPRVLRGAVHTLGSRVELEMSADKSPRKDSSLLRARWRSHDGRSLNGRALSRRARHRGPAFRKVLSHPRACRICGRFKAWSWPTDRRSERHEHHAR